MYVYFANNLYLFDNKYYNNGDKMEKSHKIIIVGLVIVVIAMVAGLAYMLTGNNLSVICQLKKDRFRKG